MKLALYDNNHNLIDILVRYSELSIESVLSTPDKILSFCYPKNLAEIIDYEGYIQTDTDEFVVKNKRDNDDNVSIQAYLNIEGLEGNVFETFNNGAITLQNCLSLALDGSGWSIGSCPETAKRTMELTDVTNAWEIIKKCITTYGVEFKLDSLNKIVNAYTKLGTDKGIYFTDQLNLIKLDTEGNSDDFYTGIKAFGKDISVTLENHQYSNKKKYYIWKDERYTDLSSLTEDAKAKLDEISKPSITYRCTVADLSKINSYYNFLSYELGDAVTLIDNVGGKKIKARIVRMTEYPNNPTNNTVDIGTNLITIERWFDNKFANYDYKLDNMNYNLNQLESNITNVNLKVDNLDNRVTNLEKGSGGATLDESIYIIDTSRSTGVKEISFNIPFTDSTSYETNWGDGIVNKEKSHTYTTDGEYTIKTQVPYSIDTSTTFVRKSLIEIVKLAENITDCRWGTSKNMGGFQYCTGLKKVGDILGIKNGFYMFSGCTNLKHPANIRDLENAEGMYSDCTNLLDTGNIPSNLKVCIYMFNGCTKLKYINNLNSITNAIAMFKNCTSIESLPSLPQTLISSSNMFSCCTMLNYEGTLKIPGNLKSAGYMFDRCTGLKCSVDFSDNTVLENTEAMFTGCNNIKSFNQIPMSISNIKSMFSGCWNATFTITKLPETTNFSYAFQNCYKLTKAIAIPETAKIVDGMYSGCKLLNSAVKIPNNVTSCVSIYSYCNKLSGVQEDVLPNNSSGVDATRAFAYSGITTAINIYNNTKAIEMFYGCNDLKTMANILDGVTTANGLYNSSGITNPNEKKLPDSLQWIDEMFANTRIEETVNYIPASCSSVRKMFFKCSKLTKITTEFLTFMANATLSKYNRQGTFFGCYAITDPDTYSNMKNGEYADWFNI